MILLFCTPAAADLTDGLIAYWQFDEGQGGIVHDASGYGNDGSISGATWVSGVCGSALDIVNTDIVGGIPWRFDDPISVAFTVAGWVSWHGPSSFDRPGVVFDGRSPVEGLWFGIQQDGCLRLNVYHPPSGGEGVISTFPVPLDAWTHLAGVFDTSSQTLRVYIAGIEAGVAREIRDLIRRMSIANPLWGAPRIVGELAKIGVDLHKSTVEKYMVRRRKPPAATWRAFLKNHIKDIVTVDFFVVPTVRNQVLFVFLVLAHERRRVLHFNVTTNPTAAWTGQQIVEAFPWVAPPKYVLRDRDGIYGHAFSRRVRSLGSEEILIAPRPPWQNPFVERRVGSIRRECLDHTIVLGERHLKRILTDYFDYYHRWRTHQSLEMDCPQSREVHAVDRGFVVEIDEVGGLHHHCERVAA
jgi:transposase InsO family protein